METITIRRFRDDDAAATARIFFEAVHEGARAHYDDRQRRAWAPEVPETAAWRARLAPQTALVAERAASNEIRAVVGFMTLTGDGCIDLAYVAPEVMGQGVAGALYDAILAEAETLGLTRLHTQASHLARAFFERRGWSVVREQRVDRAGVALTNFVMETSLP